MFSDVEKNIDIVRRSILFDEEWYRQTYQIYDENAVKHYVLSGWKKNYNPSIHFSTQEYFDRYPEIYEKQICPLLHYERVGLKENRSINIYHVEELRRKHPECVTDMQGGIMRLRITNRCPGKCRFCGQLKWSEAEQQREMNPQWYYEYCKPLYGRLNILLVTGGDSFYARESYNFMKYISEDYPNITIMTESNGMTFSEQFQQLAADNLFSTHFSLNASNVDVFRAGCWGGENADKVYHHLMSNVQNYVDLLKNKGLLCFAPDVSMVINRDTADDVHDFVKMSLRLYAKSICFYFDYTETDMDGEYFGCPETSRKALQTMLEIERVLAQKVMLQFRLWLPSKELEPIQKRVNGMDIAELRKKYADIIELAKDRNMKTEHDKRNSIRKAYQKNELTFEEEFTPTLRMDNMCGKRICSAPWKELDLYPTGRMDFCCWFKKTLNIYDYIESGVPDWNGILNSPTFMMYRRHFLDDVYQGCMLCCPLNNCHSPILDLYEYSYLQEE